MTIYDRIRQRRKELGLTIGDLAHKMGYKDKSSISKIENGKADIPQAKVYDFAKALNTSVAWLIGVPDIDDPSKPLLLKDAAVLMDYSDALEVNPIPNKVPLVSDISHDGPLLSLSHFENYEERPSSVEADFAIRSKDDSMVGARILTGDIVFVRKQPDVEDGQVALVWIGDKAIFRRVYKIPGRIQLRPENPNFSVQEFLLDKDERVEIVGLAVYFSSFIR